MKISPEPIVVTGMGLLSPLGDSVSLLWQRLLAGESAVCNWPDLQEEGYRVSKACRLENFAAPPLRRGRMLGFTAALAAIRQAGLTLPPETGVFIGSTLGESRAFEQKAEGHRLNLAGYTVESFTAFLRQKFKLSGPQRSIATACAAGNYAIGAAVSALRSGRASVALAGGVEPFSRLALVGFSRSRAMATDRCQPFDQNRSGMLLGEGAAIFVLEKANDALRRGARPLAEIVSLGLSCDAYHPTAPEPEGQGMATAIRLALEAGGIGPEVIDWVNAHGSGTRLSDSAEAKAMRYIFGERLPAISGSKGAIGHALGAASALELAICVQGLLHQTVPPTAGHEQADPEAGIICTRDARQQPIQYVLNNAFAFGGINSSLLLRRWEN
ncbi:MAG: beta-ketoacyl-[acyl-carrier-protein] synthase family protein [Saprospiraceae bacterium]|nr:beta-ketoacyl-[acyl-carrier-protein] synthase family protein [Saprospiraceae bacterium]